MATKKKIKSTDNAGNDISESIASAYQRHFLAKGKRPISVSDFCRTTKIDEATFYDHYSSFDTLEKRIWVGYLQTTIDTLRASKEYSASPVKEKLLTFYFTLVEVLKKNRSFILLMSEKGFDLVRKNALDKSHTVFIEYIDGLIKEGTDTGEVVKRPLISDKYGEAFWMQLLFVVGFWIKDESQGFENTDAAIEKAVQLSFDLVGQGAVDSMIDMAKFIFQNLK